MLFATVFTSLLAAGLALAQDYTVNTPAALIQCQPAQINWQGGVAPFILAAIPGGQPSAPVLETLADNTQDRTYVWTVSLAAGTSVTIRLTDANGDIVYSSPVTIQEGSSTDCLNASATSAAGAAGVTSGGASASVSSAAGSSVASMTSSAAGVGASVSSASSAVASGVSSASGAVSSASGAVGSSASSARSMTSGSATPVSSASTAASSAANNGAYSNAAPGVFLAALGGLAALL